MELVEWRRSEAGDDELLFAHSRASGVRDAIVTTHEAKAAIVHPPRNVKRIEMHGLIGWELEPLLPAGEDPQVACAWIESPGAADSGTLATGIRFDRLAWWKGALSRNGLRLRGILPAAGTTIANTLPAAGGRRAVVEVDHDELTWVVLNGNSVVALDTLPLRHGQQPLRVLDEVLTDDRVDEVLISSRREDCESDRLDPRCDNEDLAGESRGSIAWVAAAARSYWGSTGGFVALPVIPARVSVGKPGRRKAAGLALLAVTLAAGVASAEFWIRGAEASARSELIAAQAPLREQRSLRGRANGSRVRTEALRAEMAELRARAAALRERVERLDTFGPRRERTLPALLDGLARSISASAVVERVVEKVPGVVCVEGRAGSERAVQRLTRDLAVAMRPFDLRVTKQEIRENPSAPRDLPFSYVLVLSPERMGDT